jgi:hypothetical protein
MKTENKITRRNFLKTAGRVALGLGTITTLGISTYVSFLNHVADYVYNNGKPNKKEGESIVNFHDHIVLTPNYSLDSIYNACLKGEKDFQAVTSGVTGFDPFGAFVLAAKKEKFEHDLSKDGLILSVKKNNKPVVNFVRSEEIELRDRDNWKEVPYGYHVVSFGSKNSIKGVKTLEEAINKSVDGGGFFYFPHALAEGEFSNGLGKEYLLRVLNNKKYDGKISAVGINAQMIDIINLPGKLKKNFKLSVKGSSLNQSDYNDQLINLVKSGIIKVPRIVESDAHMMGKGQPDQINLVGNYLEGIDKTYNEASDLVTDIKHGLNSHYRYELHYIDQEGFLQWMLYSSGVLEGGVSETLLRKYYDEVYPGWREISCNND